jgi:hypothetical protein
MPSDVRAPETATLVDDYYYYPEGGYYYELAGDQE